jgi:ketosteroid isomerase-like protein
VAREAIEAVVREAHAAFNRGDVDAFMENWDEDCEYRPAGAQKTAADDHVFCGRDELRRRWEGMLDTWNDVETDVHEVQVAGDRAFVSVTLLGRGRASGVPIEAPFFQVATVRDGRIIACHDFADAGHALEAAGLRN